MLMEMGSLGWTTNETSRCQWRWLHALATNEVTALIALEFHLKLMIPSRGPNLAHHPRWMAAGGAVYNNGAIVSFFLCLLGTGGWEG